MNDDKDVRAAEYVLGLNDAVQRESARRDMETDPELRDAVARWERRLSPLAAASPEQTPPADMLARIKSALPPRLAEDATVVLLRRSVRRWRMGAILSGALAACLIVFVATHAVRDARAPAGVYVAAVNRGGDAPALIVRVNLASGRVFVRPVAAETPAGKSLELWYIAGGGAPKSMGLVGAASETLALPSETGIEKAKFAVTVEPSGGSPTGGPTGPIVYAGDLVRE